MCLAADVPLVESGTAGYLGQATVIKKVSIQIHVTALTYTNLMLFITPVTVGFVFLFEHGARKKLEFQLAPWTSSSQILLALSKSYSCRLLFYMYLVGN